MEDRRNRLAAVPAVDGSRVARAAPGRGTGGTMEPPGWATAATVAATVTAVQAVLDVLRHALTPILLVAALAFVLRPIVRVPQRRLRVPKLAGVILVHVAVLAVAGLVAWDLVGEVGAEAVEGASDAPRPLTEEVERRIGPQVHAFGQDVGAEDLSRRIVEGVESAVARPDLALPAGGAAVADVRGLPTFPSFMGPAIFLRVSVDDVVGPLLPGRAVTLLPSVIIAAVPVAAASKTVLAAWCGEDDGQGEGVSS